MNANTLYFAKVSLTIGLCQRKVARAKRPNGQVFAFITKCTGAEQNVRRIVNKNKTTKAITFKFEHDKDPFTTDIITIFLEKSIKNRRCYDGYPEHAMTSLGVMTALC